MRVDLHVHSHFSPDAISSPRAICRAALRRGLDGIALTDHGTTAGWEAMREAAGSAGLLFIPGEERTVVEGGRIVGEVLCLFLCEPVRACDLLGILSEVQQQGGLLVAAHPFDARRPALARSGLLAGGGGQLGVEVRNGRGYGGKANTRALAWARARRAPQTAGSDAHTPSEVGKVCVEAEAGTADELRQTILTRGVSISGRPSSPVYSLWSGMRKLTSRGFLSGSWASAPRARGCPAR